MISDLPDGQSGATPRWKPAEWAPLVGTSVLFCVLLGLGAGGVRGTDQYWYVADVERIASAESATTNHVFPVSVLEGRDLPRPFVHNSPVLYVMAGLAVFLGGYAAWMLTGILFTLATAVLIARATAAWVTVRAGARVASIYLLLPLTLWQASQPLLETSLTLLVVTAASLVARPRAKAGRWLLATLVVGLLFWSRYTFLPLLVGMPVAFAWITRRDLRRHAIALLLLVATVVALVVLEPVLFPPFERYSLAEYVNGTLTWKESNMLFVRPADSLTVATLLKKAGSAVVQQVVPDILPASAFYWPFSVMVVLFLMSMHKRRGRPLNPWMIVTVALLLLHLATIILYRNQFRYLLPVTPPLLICLAIGLRGSWHGRLPRMLAVGGLLAVLCVGVALMLESRNSGRDADELRRELTSFYGDHLSDGTPVLVEYRSADELVHGFVLRPRLVGYVDSTLSRADLETMRERLGAHWVVTSAPQQWGQGSLQRVASMPSSDTLAVALYKVAADH